MNKGKLTRVSIEVREFSAVDESHCNTCKLCDFNNYLYCPFSDGSEECGARYFKFIKEIENEKI